MFLKILYLTAVFTVQRYVEGVNAPVVQEERFSERFSIWLVISRDAIYVFESLKNKVNG